MTRPDPDKIVDPVTRDPVDPFHLCSEPLLNALLQGMEKRFGTELSLSGAIADKIIAAVARPFFKLRWLPDDKKDQCGQLFVEDVRN